MPIQRAANQKLITVTKSVCDKNHTYTLFNLKDFNIARRVLSSNAFCLWTYIAQNQSGYSFALSKEAFDKYTGLKKTAYDGAVNELIKYGYLRLEEGTKTNFIF